MRWLLLAGLLCVAPALAGAAEKSPAKAEKPLPEKPLPAKPEAFVEELEALLIEDEVDGPMDAKAMEAFWKKQIARVDALVAGFRQQYPEHPLRWEVAFWEANSFDVRSEVQIPLPAGARPSLEIYAEIAAAAEASPAIRARASGERVLALSDQVMEEKLPLAEWEKSLSEHLAQYPDYPQNVMLQEQRVNMIQELEPARVLALLEELAKSPNSEVAAMAKANLGVAREREQLKTKPLELKFKAADGTDVDLEKLRGKVVLVQFWATWCGPCVAELPQLVELYKKHHEQGFEILGVSLDDEEKNFQALLKKRKIAWPQHFDGLGWETPLAKRFGIEQLPTLWLVNKQGMVVDLDADKDLAAKVAKLLAE